MARGDSRRRQSEYHSGALNTAMRAIRMSDHMIHRARQRVHATRERVRLMQEKIERHKRWRAARQDVDERYPADSPAHARRFRPA
jgi:hypothetical protein